MNADQVFERDPVPARKTLVADELGGILIQAWLDTKGLPDVPEKAWCRFLARFERRASQYVRRLKRELHGAGKREDAADGE